MDSFSVGDMVAKIKKVLVCGAGGFIGNYLVASLKQQGCYVIGADLKSPQYNNTQADEFYLYDLTQPALANKLLSSDIDTVYQLAADMGGAEYIFTGNNDADIMNNSALINLNILRGMIVAGIKNVFFTSSACIYPGYNQKNNLSPLLNEQSAYPAEPDSEYGWEKLFSERLYLSFARNYGLRVRIARLHNIFGPFGSWQDNRAKAPAALCRKVALSDGTIEVWGKGDQTRSFLYIDQCIEGIHRIQNGNYDQPLNLGSARMISINDLARLIARIANKDIVIDNIAGPVGVQGRTSDNTLIKEKLDWEPKDQLEYGLENLYSWINQMIRGKS